ncbi:hypothetical protein A3Q56_04950 [Intoshia linei]|uniref:Uncharacterized protein n=1 Tax=Intoshia linei TaxID=1819745 RepID=A0A177B106_9BILA|nr:hypothetical protein A3Q56_04950 [Intoshia linei]
MTAKVQLINKSETNEKEIINLSNYQNFIKKNLVKIKNCTLYFSRLEIDENKEIYLNEWLDSMVEENLRKLVETQKLKKDEDKQLECTVEKHLRKCQETEKLKKDKNKQITNHSRKSHIEKIPKM